MLDTPRNLCYNEWTQIFGHTRAGYLTCLTGARVAPPNTAYNWVLWKTFGCQSPATVRVDPKPLQPPQPPPTLNLYDLIKYSI